MDVKLDFWFEEKVLSRIFGPNRDEVTEAGENYIMRSSVVYTLRQLLDLLA
jgi:hypothetical protein